MSGPARFAFGSLTSPWPGRELGSIAWWILEKSARPSPPPNVLRSLKLQFARLRESRRVSGGDTPFHGASSSLN
jgi:hypothetical protein